MVDEKHIPTLEEIIAEMRKKEEEEEKKSKHLSGWAEQVVIMYDRIGRKL